MRFLLRTMFWLGVVLVLLPSNGSQPSPKSQISASEAFSAAEGVLSDIQHFCERQKEACVVGSRTAVTIGQRAQAGAKTLYELLSARFVAKEPKSIRNAASVPLPPERPSLDRLRPTG